jgi:Fe-S-cluster containining protein
MDDPSVCARCAGKGPTCCQTTAPADDFCFPVSAGEELWLIPYMEGRAVTCTAVTGTLFQQRLKSLFPNERRRVAEVFPKGGMHRRLALDREGRCILLSPSGCSIPREARPLYCRLFPFWVVDERLTFLSHGDCLAQYGTPAISDILRRLDTSAEEILSIYRRLRHYWHIDSETEE